MTTDSVCRAMAKTDPSQKAHAGRPGAGTATTAARRRGRPSNGNKTPSPFREFRPVGFHVPTDRKTSGKGRIRVTLRPPPNSPAAPRPRRGRRPAKRGTERAGTGGNRENSILVHLFAPTRLGEGPPRQDSPRRPQHHPGRHISHLRRKPLDQDRSAARTCNANKCDTHHIFTMVLQP